MEFFKHLTYLCILITLIICNVDSQTSDSPTTIDMDMMDEEVTQDATTIELITTKLTTAPTELTTAPTTALVTVYNAPVSVKASISLDQTYTSDLADSSSSAYQTLQEDFKSNMDEEMTTTFGDAYNRTEVLGFSPGSVVVDFQIIFNEAPVASDADSVLEATSTAVESAIQTAISGGSLGNFTVVAGSFGLKADLQVYSFAFADSASDLDFDTDVDNIYEMAITLKNTGGNTIQSISGDGDSSNNAANNWAIYFIVSDTSDIEDASAMTLWTVADVSDATNMKAGVSSGNSLVIADVFAMVNIPEADCALYTHFCVKVNSTTDAVWSDSDPSNDYSCIQSFGYQDTDYLPCSGCISRASLLVIFFAIATHLISL